MKDTSSNEDEKPLELDEWGYVVPVKPKWWDHWLADINKNETRD